MTRAPARRHGYAGRTGFTLVELLVVIAIIAILLTLSAAAIIRTLGLQQSANSKATLTKVQSQLNKQWSAAADRFQKETLPPADSTLKSVYNTVVLPMSSAGGVPDKERARVIWVKLRLKQMFPETMAEAFNPAPMPPLANYVNYLSALGYSGATPPAPEHSSILLVMALTRGEGGNTTKVEDLGANGGNVKDFPAPTAGQSAKGLVDGWGNPLAFCRWPTGSPQLNPNGPQPGANNDPGDPTGRLTVVAWLNDPGGGAAQFQQAAHVLAGPNQQTNEPQTYRLAPLVAAPGPDGVLALDPLTFAIQSPAANDDQYPTLSANP